MAIEAVESRRGLRLAREADTTVGLLRRLDWLLLLALVATVAFGLWAINGITLHDPGGSALTHQALYAFAGALLFTAVLFVNPDVYRRLWRPIYIATTGIMLRS